MVEITLLGPQSEVERVIEALGVGFSIQSKEFDGWNQGQAQYTVTLDANPLANHPLSEETLFCANCGQVAYRFQILADETDILKDYLKGQKVYCDECEPDFAAEFFTGLEAFGLTSP